MDEKVISSSYLHFDCGLRNKRSALRSVREKFTGECFMATNKAGTPSVKVHNGLLPTPPMPKRGSARCVMGHLFGGGVEASAGFFPPEGSTP